SPGRKGRSGWGSIGTAGSIRSIPRPGRSCARSSPTASSPGSPGWTERSATGRSSNGRRPANARDAARRQRVGARVRRWRSVLLRRWRDREGAGRSPAQARRRDGPGPRRLRAQVIMRRSIGRAWALLAAACALATAAHAEPRTTLADGATGKVEFRTYTPASQAPLLTRAYLSGPPAVVSGTLSLPKGGGPLERDGKSPAVILVHGSGGISDERELAWARRFNSWGIAAFVVDSYTGRGLTPPVYANSPGYTHMVAHLVDAYLALQLIGTHPRVDGSRVAIMGGSRGGEVSVNAIFERFRQGALANAPNRFAAYIPFYPYCNFRHMGKDLAIAPMLMLLGGADDMTEPAPCEHFAAELKERGVPVRVVVYPNAFHGFDRQAQV